MNTPGHSILNLAILGRIQQPTRNWAIFIGSWVPDAALFGFYLWAKLVGIPEAIIWRETYYDPTWQEVFAIGNSIPLALVGIGLCYWRKLPHLLALCSSMLLHQLEDLPLHHDDAHRHFWPLSDYRFFSPVSYWDEDHFGRYGALAEMSLVLLASVVLWRRTRSRWGRGLLLGVNALYGLAYWTQYMGPHF
ncbi:MAG TPA: hypothetical protein V6D02_17085 [Candidatus Obscuribacterales bacterium]